MRDRFFALNRPLNFFHVRYRRLFAMIKNSFRNKKKHGRKIHLVSGKPPFIAACLTTYLLTIAILVGIIWFIVPQISNSITLFRDNFSDYTNNFVNFIESNKFNIHSFLDDKIDINEIMEKIQNKLSSITEYIPTVLSKTYDITSGIISGTIDVVVGIVFQYIFCLTSKVSRRMQNLLPNLL